MTEQKTTPGLLNTKLYRPQPPSNLVMRQWLLEWLSQHRQRPLTLVSASAGYGKSTLISSWLESVDSPSAWVSLDEHDDDLTIFLSYFIAAVQTILPDAGQKTEALLNAPSLAPLKVLTRSLTGELAQFTDPFILVLDDYHVIRTTAIHDLLSELLRHPPRALHLVIVTRSDPPLPIIKLRARAQVTEIRSQELRFTAAETGVFLQQLGVQVNETTAADLTQKTEGWVTGLRLSALSLRHRGAKLPLTRLPDNFHYVSDYLISETLSQLSPAIRDFLLKTSVLDRLCGPLCDAVCFGETKAPSSSGGTAVTGLDEPEYDGQSCLEWLYQQNLFIIPLDDQRKWYRYHHLFQDLLLDQLKQRLDEDEIRDLHRKAGDWLAQANLIDEALHHSLAGEDVIGAAQLVEQNSYPILEDGRFPVLERWLNQLPDEVVQQRPKLLLATAWVSHFQGAFERIPSILQVLDGLLLETEPIEQMQEGDLDFFNAVLCFWNWQIEPSMELFRRALERMPNANLGGRNEAELYFACAGQMTGQGEMITRTYRQMLHNETSDGPRKGYLLATLAFVHLYAGKLAMVCEIAQQMEAVGDRTNNAIIGGWGSYLMGYVEYEWNNLEAACQYFSQAVKKRYFLDINLPIETYAGLIFSYQGMQQADKASETVDQMLEFAQETNNPLHFNLAGSVQARLALLEGDLLSATRWLETTDVSFDAGTMFFWLEHPRITQCRVLIAQGSESSLRKAVEKLEEYWQLCQATHNTPRIVEILLLLFSIFCNQEQYDEAMAALKKVVNLAQPGGYIRPFLDTGSIVIGPLERLKRQGVAPEYIGQILTAFENLQLENNIIANPTPLRFGDYSRKSEIVNPLIDPLSNRELDVLELLAQRFSNKEIAAKLFISPLTVKKHTVNIYQKLDVKNRRQAVSKAIALGLVANP